MALPPTHSPEVRVRRIHRRDLNRAWDFLKLVFRDVNRETVEYQRPRTKRRFTEVYDLEDVEQLLFEVKAEEGVQIVGYAECAFEGRGVGSFMLEQVEHMARVRGCTHLVLEVAENNDNALKFYRTRSFHKLDAAIFLAKKVGTEAALLPPRKLKRTRAPGKAAARPAAKT